MPTRECQAPIAFPPCCKATNDATCCLSTGTLHPIDVSALKAPERASHCDPRKLCFDKNNCGGDLCHLDPRGAAWGYCGP